MGVVEEGDNMEILKKFFNKRKRDKSVVLSTEKETVFEKQKILDAFIDHGLCSSKHNCKSYLGFGKCLQAQDIKYIYERTIKLAGLMEDDKPRCCIK